MEDISAKKDKTLEANPIQNNRSWEFSDSYGWVCLEEDPKDREDQKEVESNEKEVKLSNKFQIYSGDWVWIKGKGLGQTREIIKEEVTPTEENSDSCQAKKVEEVNEEQNDLEKQDAKSEGELTEISKMDTVEASESEPQVSTLKRDQSQFLLPKKDKPSKPEEPIKMIQKTEETKKKAEISWRAKCNLNGQDTEVLQKDISKKIEIKLVFYEDDKVLEKFCVENLNEPLIRLIESLRSRELSPRCSSGALFFVNGLQLDLCQLLPKRAYEIILARLKEIPKNEESPEAEGDSKEVKIEPEESKQVEKPIEEIEENNTGKKSEIKQNQLGGIEEVKNELYDEVIHFEESQNDLDNIQMTEKKKSEEKKVISSNLEKSKSEVKKEKKARPSSSQARIEIYKSESDSVLYFTERAKVLDLLESQDLNAVPSLTLEIVSFFPEELSVMQTYSYKLLTPCKNPSIEFICSKSILVYGFQVYGPYPHSEKGGGVSIRFIGFNLATEQQTQGHLQAVGGPSRELSVYLNEPLVVNHGDLVHIGPINALKCELKGDQYKWTKSIDKSNDLVDLNGAVYELYSETSTHYGDDGVKFDIKNYENIGVGGLFYSILE